MDFKIKTSVFEGPIATLHEMILDRKLSISEVSLSGVVDDFLDYVRQLQKEIGDKYKEEMSAFILTSSILILLKSKSLLPENLFEEEENRSIEILENQLRAFDLIKGVQKSLRKILFKNILQTQSIKVDLENKLFIPDVQITQKAMYEYISQKLSEIGEVEEKRQEVKVEKNIKIEDALSHIRNIIKRLNKFSFNNAHSEGDDHRLREKSKKTVVILFLAILELVKMGEIKVSQDEHMGEIIVLGS